MTLDKQVFLIFFILFSDSIHVKSTRFTFKESLAGVGV